MDRSDYVLTGKVDLLVKTASGIDLIDFKTLPRPGKDSAILEQYEQQLYFYAHALEQCSRQRPDRLFLYWTAEERKENALMEIPYSTECLKKVSLAIDETASAMKAGRFHVWKPPAPEICQSCDLCHLCRRDGVI
jgi:DNA helicase-2/ATP-dependent DNA helicase PcrA